MTNTSAQHTATPKSVPLFAVVIAYALAAFFILNAGSISRAHTASQMRVLDDSIKDMVYVEKGDSLSAIAARAEVPESSRLYLVDWLEKNNHLASAHIQEGQILQVPHCINTIKYTKN